MVAIDAPFPPRAVLIVDDDEVAAQSLAATLKCAGITNLRIVLDSGIVPSMLVRETFSLVLLDLNQPWPCGAEMLRSMTKLECPTPILVVTSSYRNDMPTFCSRDGTVVKCLVKPVDQSQLLGAVQTALFGQGL